MINTDHKPDKLQMKPTRFIVITNLADEPSVVTVSLEVSAHDTVGQAYIVKVFKAAAQQDNGKPLAGMFKDADGGTVYFTRDGEVADPRAYLPMNERINESRRALNFDEAKRLHVRRFTLDNIPDWAHEERLNGRYFSPRHRSDAEWYENTCFEDEHKLSSPMLPYSTTETSPLGASLPVPYTHELGMLCRIYEAELVQA